VIEGSMMRPERTFFSLVRMGRARKTVIAVLAGAAALTVSGVVIPKPAMAWWRGGVWVSGPGYYPYYGPRPYYYAPPIVVAPPPVYYAPPPVIYAAPPPPPVYYPPQPSTYPVVARTCYAPTLTCPMEVPRSPGSTCYCSDATGDRSYGTAR
jgi:hypothetical protein